MHTRRYSGSHKRSFVTLALTLAFALLALLPLGASAAPHAQSGAPQVAMTIQAGYGDDASYMIGEWFPVRVTLANPTGAPSRRVRVEVDSIAGTGTASSTYAREVDLPSPARKEVTLYAYNQNYGHSLEVRLVQGDAVLKNVQVDINPLEPSTDMLVGVVSSDASALNVLRGEKAGHAPVRLFANRYGGPRTVGPGTQARVSISHIALADLPPVPAALDNFAALVLEDADTNSLSPEQKSALAVWVSHGGTLIVAPRPGGADVTSGLADLLPVKVSPGNYVPRTSIDSLGALVSMPMTPSASLQVPAAVLNSDSGVAARVLAQSDAVPLLAVRDLGEGQVYYLALSPALPPLRGWDGLVPLFKRLLAEHEISSSLTSMQAQNLYSNYAYSQGYMQGSIFPVFGDILDLPGLDLPSGWLLALFLLVYIIIVGPINFFVLRRLRRAELAWITIPALVVLFSVGAYALAYGAKGGDLIMPRANITYSAPGVDEATGVQVMGLFSPLRRSYSLRMNADSLVSQLDRYGYGGSGAGAPRVMGSGGTTMIDNVVVDTGSIKGFAAQSPVKNPARLEADLHLGTDMIEGTLRNASTSALQDVVLLRGDAMQYLGYIAPGASVQVRLPVSYLPFNNNSPSLFLPPPPGVSAPSSNNYYGQQSAEQRAYNRKVSVLDMALISVLSSDRPTSPDVLALAWGGQTPVEVDVEGHAARTEEVSLWMSRLPVKGTADASAQMSRGVPFWTYAAGNEMAWLAGPPTQGLNPYADLNFALPAGTQPRSLSLVYDLGAQGISDVDWLAYNVHTGQWDRLAGLMDVPVSPGVVPPAPVPTQYALPIPVPTADPYATPTPTPRPYEPGQAGARVLNLDPARYVGPGGDVTVRLYSNAGNPTIIFGSLALLLNQQP